MGRFKRSLISLRRWHRT